MSVSTVPFNERKYLNLLGRALPVVIRTDEEYARTMGAIDGLMQKSEQDLTEEEGSLLELLTVLAEEYEDRVNPLPRGKPPKMLSHLLEETGKKAATFGRFCRRAGSRRS
jgi:antitoxin component HigA of HigAB toxin-antitoxin module